jgi:hypothetical protein
VIEQGGAKARAYVYLGSSPGGLSGSSSEIVLPADTVRNGTPAFMGDFNGDGCDDLAVASSEREQGILSVYAGSPVGLLSDPSRFAFWND